jgi:hypothetical protein
MTVSRLSARVNGSPAYAKATAGRQFVAPYSIIAHVDGCAHLHAVVK